MVGFGSPCTLLTLPLSPNVLLYGRLGDIKVESPLTLKHIAVINTSTACASHRFVYSHSLEFALRNDTAVWSVAQAS